MNKPSDYKYIRAWGKLLGSYPYYIKDEQQRAAEDGAPLTAIHYSLGEKRWVTFQEIEREDTKQWIQAFLLEETGE